jgi:NADH:ubiquinone oxidoreductase subunit 4 (subunit M)
MWESSLIELLTYYSWNFIHILFIENSILKVFIKHDIHIFICLWEWGWAPHF